MFINDWSGNGIDGVKNDFEIDQSELDGVEVLLASYSYQCYEGDAFVLFRKDGLLFEVNGGHCSCYGLEGQWEPEETSVEALRKRIEAGGYWIEEYKNELEQVLNSIEKGN